MIAGPVAVDGRIPGLDGIRALAIALVLLFHMNLVGMGWIGVQLFFVLSGFLITRVLLEGKDGRGLVHYLKTFYGRRMLRIFPLYYLYLIVVMVTAAAWLRDTAPGARALEQWLPAFTYVYNWNAMLPGQERSYFLTHLWSLAIEEQFYLLWPFVVYGLSRAGLKRLLVALVLAGPLLRFAVFVLWPLPPPRIYEAVGICTLSQLDAFAIGALLNLVQPQAGRAPWWLGGAIVVAYGLGAWTNGAGIAPATQFATPLSLGYPNALPRYFQFVWGYSVVNLLSAMLIWALAFGSWGKRLACWRPVQGLGRISYGVYVLHFPIAHLLSPLVYRINEATGAGLYASILIWAPMYLALVIGLSALSWVAFERPVLRLKERYFPS